MPPFSSATFKQFLSNLLKRLSYTKKYSSLRHDVFITNCYVLFSLHDMIKNTWYIALDYKARRDEPVLLRHYIISHLPSEVTVAYLWAKISLFSCSFGQIVCWCPLPEGLARSLGNPGSATASHVQTVSDVKQVRWRFRRVGVGACSSLSSFFMQFSGELLKISGWCPHFWVWSPLLREMLDPPLKFTDTRLC